MTPTILTFKTLPFSEQISYILNVLNNPEDAKKLRYRNSTGEVLLENGQLITLWCDQKSVLDQNNMQYVSMGSSAYTAQAFFYFKAKGEIVKVNTRDVWGKKDPNKIYDEVIQRTLKSNPTIDSCEIFISPYKKDYRYVGLVI